MTKAPTLHLQWFHSRFRPTKGIPANFSQSIL
jgi:hypothetical protein